MKWLWILGLSLGWSLISNETRASPADAAGNPCAQILFACEAKGYVEDSVAEAGHRIWADCANVMINSDQKVRGIDLEDPQITACRKYKAIRTGYLIDRE